MANRFSLNEVADLLSNINDDDDDKDYNSSSSEEDDDDEHERVFLQPQQLRKKARVLEVAEKNYTTLSTFVVPDSDAIQQESDLVSFGNAERSGSGSPLTSSKIVENTNKKKRCRTATEKMKRDVLEHPMKSPCPDTCKKKLQKSFW